MCYYDQIFFTCNCWKWSHFRKHCENESRLGETCGMKLVKSTHREDTKCAMCISIDRKIRCYVKAMADYERWILDPTKQKSAIKAKEHCEDLQKEIETLEADRAARHSTLGATRARPRRLSKLSSTDMTQPAGVNSSQSSKDVSASTADESSLIDADATLRMSLMYQQALRSSGILPDMCSLE